MTGLVMVGGDAAACEGDACLLPTAAAGPGSAPTPVGTSAPLAAPTSERALGHDDVETPTPTDDIASHTA